MNFDEVRNILRPKSSTLDEKLSLFREDRDNWNGKVKKYLTERNEINRQVKELISEVQNQRVIREEGKFEGKRIDNYSSREIFCSQTTAWGTTRKKTCRTA